MKNAKPDRRVLRTKQALKENLLLLLEEQPIQKISVSRLCEKSDINRSTFYTYFTDPMDLLRSIQDEFFEELKDSLDQFQKENSIEQLMKSTIHCISEHKKLIRLIFSGHGDPAFLNKITSMTQEKTVASWQRLYPDYIESKLIALHTFIVRGCIGIIEQWIANDFQESEEEVSYLLETFSSVTSHGYLK